MYLQDAIDDALPELRAEALARMTSRCTIRRNTGETSWDEENGRNTPVWAVVDTDVPCRVAGPSGANTSRTVSAPGGDLELATRTLHLPHDRHYADGDLADITAGECVGDVLRIEDAGKRDQATAYRVPVVEVQRPEEWV